MNAAIIVAAGRGTRMGPGMDKLFFEVEGFPVVGHSWRAIDAASSIDSVVVVVRAGMENAFEELAVSCRIRKPFKIVTGGSERQDSVWNGLEAIPPGTKIVAIQDGARPCTPAALIDATVRAAAETGAAVAAQPVTDTIKASEDGQFISHHLERRKLWAVQTPQTFRVGVIRTALKAVRDRGASVTDDTAACELIGQRVALVRSDLPNPKVTVAADLEMVASLLRRQAENSQ